MSKNVSAWCEKAEYDIKTAKVMLDTGRYNYVPFMLQQAIEKMLKAIYVKKCDKIPVRSHNLIYLAKKISLNFEDTETPELFKRLTSYYVRIRYDTSYNINERDAKELYNRGLEVYEWLEGILRG